jgi:3-hydroxybutyryl-CoA dehydrogenase
MKNASYTESGEGIYAYDDNLISQKLDERDRNFIKLGKIKARVKPQQVN